MKRRAFVPLSPAPLDERITPSPSRVAAIAAARPPAVTQAESLNLSGFILGTDTTVKTVHRLESSGGTINPLGTVSLSGFLVIPKTGPAHRSVHGTVTLANAEGTVTMTLKGTVTIFKGSSPLASGSLSYKITSGTKTDAGATGTGTLSYGPGPVFMRGRFLLDFGNYPPPP